MERSERGILVGEISGGLFKGSSAGNIFGEGCVELDAKAK